MRYFLAVARKESICGAAEALHLSQPTLSRQLMDLEAELGKKLFLRGNRRITLTEDGVLLRKRAEEILDLVEKTTGELAAEPAGLAGDIYIGAGKPGAFTFSRGRPAVSRSGIPRFTSTSPAATPPT